MPQVLAHTRSRMLWIQNMELSASDTACLVSTLDTGVRVLLLGAGVTLDAATLVQYDGKGTCDKIELREDIRRVFGVLANSWAESMGWEISWEREDRIEMRRA